MPALSQFRINLILIDRWWTNNQHCRHLACTPWAHPPPNAASNPCPWRCCVALLAHISTATTCHSNPPSTSASQAPVFLLRMSARSVRRYSQWLLKVSSLKNTCAWISTLSFMLLIASSPTNCCPAWSTYSALLLSWLEFKSKACSPARKFGWLNRKSIGKNPRFPNIKHLRKCVWCLNRVKNSYCTPNSRANLSSCISKDWGTCSWTQTNKSKATWSRK